MILSPFRKWPLAISSMPSATLAGKALPPERTALSQVVQKCLSCISVHLHETISLDLLSRRCGLCGRSLSIRFKEEMHMGIPEYIHREKLREAAYLLRHTDYSLSEITICLNYPSQSCFTQIFKKYRSVTPQQYRNAVPLRPYRGQAAGPVLFPALPALSSCPSLSGSGSFPFTRISIFDILNM